MQYQFIKASLMQCTYQYIQNIQQLCQYVYTYNFIIMLMTVLKNPYRYQRYI